MGLLQIVHLETNDADAALIAAELKNGGIESELIRVRNETELVQEIARQPVDIILANPSCPRCDGLRALTSAREARPAVPFIFVSGPECREQIGEALRAGATDFILKEHLPRLAPSILRIIQEAHTQRDLEKARQELLRHAELLDLANDAIVISDAAGKISYWNRGAETDVWLVARGSDRVRCSYALADRSTRKVGGGNAGAAGKAPLGRGDRAKPQGRRTNRCLDWLDASGQ